MGKCSIIYREIRFNVDHEDLTDVYVLIDAQGDCPHTVPGWYHKQFLALMSTRDIHAALFTGEDMDPMRWEKRDPPNTPSSHREQALTHAIIMARGLLAQVAQQPLRTPMQADLVRTAHEYLRDALYPPTPRKEGA